MNDKITDKYRPFKAVIFDADGVVIDTQSIYSKADSAFLNNHNVNAGSQEFEHLLTGVSLENGTNPDIYLHAAKQLGTEPVECLVVEDAPNGILAAKSAGMKCIALATTHDAALLKGADQIVKSYAEINLDKFLTQ